MTTRHVLILAEDAPLDALLAAATAAQWRLRRIAPLRLTHHAGRVWQTPQGQTVHYIEDERFDARYLVCASQKPLEGLREALSTRDPSSLRDGITDPATPRRHEALHTLIAATCSPEEVDVQAVELLQSALDEDAIVFKIAALQLCEWLGWQALAPAITPLTTRDWPGLELARRALDACR